MVFLIFLIFFFFFFGDDLGADKTASKIYSMCAEMYATKNEHVNMCVGVVSVCVCACHQNGFLGYLNFQLEFIHTHAQMGKGVAGREGKQK